MSPKKKKRVLIIDDDKHFIRYFESHLHAWNYEIVGEAQDSQYAIKLFQSNKPDLILLDFEMLSKTGMKILEEILPRNPEAIVLMLRGRGDAETMQFCLDEGIYHYIRKDDSLKTIFSVIEESLKNFSAIGSQMYDAHRPENLDGFL